MGGKILFTLGIYQLVHKESDLSHIFKPLVEYTDERKHQREERDRHSTVQLVQCKGSSVSASEDQLREQISQIGCKVKIRWTKEEIGDTGWKAGWYVAEVQGYDIDTDVLTVHYSSEPDCTYESELTPLIVQNKVKLVQSLL